MKSSYFGIFHVLFYDKLEKYFVVTIKHGFDFNAFSILFRQKSLFIPKDKIN